MQTPRLKQMLPLLSLAFLISGCSLGLWSEGQPTTSATPFVTVSPARTDSPSSIAMPPILVCNISQPPAELKNTIVLTGDYYISLPPHRGPSYVWNSNDEVKRGIFPGEPYVQDYSMSPDGRWLATFITVENAPGGRVVILGAEATPSTDISDDKWVMLAGWVNENQVMVANLTVNPVPATMINQKTQSRQEFLPDYPGIYEGYPWVLWGGYSSVETVYSPNLNYVIYPTAPQSFNLWDRRKNSLVREILSSSPTSEAPLWLRDGQRAIMDLGLGPSWMMDGSRYKEELFLVDVHGEEHRLTYLTDYFEEIEIRGFSLSGDERFVAFWFRPAATDQRRFQLGVLDRITRTIKAYCVYSVPFLHAPVWSPDNAQLLAAGFLNDLNGYGTILVDVDEGTISQLDKASVPMGWILDHR